MEENPIKSSINYLIDCGWTKEQATNLVKAIHDESPERLWEVAPEWVEHCGECMKYVNGMLGTVALGLVNVRKGKEGWLMGLNEKGMEVGKQMEGK